MFTRPPGLAGLEGQKPDGAPAAKWYGCGWTVRAAGPGGKGRNTWHTGELPGTSTVVVRRWDGMDWVVLFNQRSNEKDEDSVNLIDLTLAGAIDQVKEWPAGKGREEKWP